MVKRLGLSGGLLECVYRPLKHGVSSTEDVLSSPGSGTSSLTILVCGGEGECDTLEKIICACSNGMAVAVRGVASRGVHPQIDNSSIFHVVLNHKVGFNWRQLLTTTRL